jgi:hypothetical protein
LGIIFGRAIGAAAATIEDHDDAVPR